MNPSKELTAACSASYAEPSLSHVEAVWMGLSVAHELVHEDGLSALPVLADVGCSARPVGALADRLHEVLQTESFFLAGRHAPKDRRLRCCRRADETAEIVFDVIVGLFHVHGALVAPFLLRAATRQSRVCVFGAEHERDGRALDVGSNPLSVGVGHVVFLAPSGQCMTPPKINQVIDLARDPVAH